MSDSAKNNAEQVSGVSNLAFDMLTLLHNKLEGIAALEAYKADAQGNQEATALLDQLQQVAVQDVQTIKPLLVQQLGK